MLIKVKPSLKNLREATGFTQLKFSQLLHIHQTTYSKIEKGEGTLQPEIALKIAEILKVPVEDFAETSGTLYHITGNNFSQSSISGPVHNHSDELQRAKIIELSALLVPLCKELLDKLMSKRD
jgi:transcriptional regulator with XRE-family HTH domain